MFELNVEQKVKSGHLAMQGKGIPGSENRITLKPYTNRPHFQILFPYIVCFGHTVSWCSSNRTGSANSHSILRAFASAAPSAWNDLPSDSCKASFLNLLQVFAQMSPDFQWGLTWLSYFKLSSSHSLVTTLFFPQHLLLSDMVYKYSTTY